jgi:hypothetical protein
MKSLLQFMREAESQASMQAKKLNLASDGHGSWMDTRGNIVATTEKGKLVFLKGRKKKGEEEGPGRVKGKAEEPKARPQAAAVPQAAPKAKEGDPEGGGGAGEDTLTIVFGRFNPPTIGHEKLLQAAEKAAVGGELKIYPSRTSDPKKNPIDPDMKISYMKKMFPDYEEQIINDSEMISIFDVLTTANEDGYTSVNIVVGADRQAEFENLANKYNGELYDFKQIRVISAGVRDADAEGVEGMSASKLRKAVQDDDFDTFRRGIPKKLTNADTQALFDAVRTGMSKAKSKKKKKEVSEVWQIAPRIDQRGLRENYVKGLIYKMGDLVESLNTGLIGKIIRRGTNHLICVTEEDYMFKSWIRDVMEYTEKRMPSRTRDKGHPNTLVGTGGYRKNAMAATGTKTIKNFDFKEFLNKYRKK